MLFLTVGRDWSSSGCKEIPEKQDISGITGLVTGVAGGDGHNNGKT